jgi:hypothetical protein
VATIIGACWQCSATCVPDDLLARYDLEERREAIVVGMRREVSGDVVRQVDLVGNSSVVLYSALSESNADEAIEEQKAYFAELGHEFEWKGYAHDQPFDLVERLRVHGFALEERETIVVLDVEHAPQTFFEPTRNVRRIDDPAELRALLPAVKDWPTDRFEALARELAAAPEQLSVYVAEVDEKVAACGWVRFPVNTSFASLWGGTTVPAMRNRGLYLQLVAARVQEARARSFGYVTVDARSMSRPILERRGFRTLTWATPCTWTPVG